MPHQDKSQKFYLDLGINLEWPQAFQLIFSQERYGQDLGIPTPTQGKCLIVQGIHNHN